MAGPKDKSKKSKQTTRTDKDGNKVYLYDSPSEAYTKKIYKKGGTKSGVEEFSIIDKTGKSSTGSFSGRTKTLDTKPNKRVKTTQYMDSPRTKNVATSSTQTGKSSTKYRVPNKKSGAGYSGD